MKGIMLAALAAFSLNVFADDIGGICTKDDLTGESIVVTNATVAIGTAISDGDRDVMAWVQRQDYMNWTRVRNKTLLKTLSDYTSEYDSNSVSVPGFECPRGLLTTHYEANLPPKTGGTYDQGYGYETNCWGGLMPYGPYTREEAVKEHFPGGTASPDQYSKTVTVAVTKPDGVRIVKSESDDVYDFIYKPIGPNGVFGYGTKVADYLLLWPLSAGRLATEGWVTDRGYLTSYTEADPEFKDFQTNTTEFAIGLGAEAKGYMQTWGQTQYQSGGGIAIGRQAKAYMPTAAVSSYGNIAIGYQAQAGVNDTNAQLPLSNASSMAIGRGTKADQQSIAIGSIAKASAASVVVGAFDEATDSKCTVVGAYNANVYGQPYFGRTAYGSQLFGSNIASTNRYATVIGYGDVSLTESDGSYRLSGTVGVSHGDDTVNFTAPDTRHFYIGGTNLCDRLKLIIDAMVTAGVMTSEQADTVKAAIK